MRVEIIIDPRAERDKSEADAVFDSTDVGGYRQCRRPWRAPRESAEDDPWGARKFTATVGVVLSVATSTMR